MYLDESGRIAIVVYAGYSGVLRESTAGNEKNKILGALEHLQSSGGTKGAAGIEAAYQAMKTEP